MSYPKIKIGDFAKISGGKRLPKGEELIQIKTSHPYIRAQDIGNGKIGFNDSVYLDDNTFNKIKKYTVETNDICITIVGAYVGDVGIVPSHLSGANLTENAVKLTDLRDYDPKFLNYALLDEDSQSQMKLFAAGAAQPKLGLYKIEEIKVPNPPLRLQRKIATILSAYDDLIENNTRRIKILEEMAQALYREWFVNFRFPGHEKARMVDSPLGMIPVGWEAVTIRDISSYINRGISPKYDDESKSIVINQKCIRDGKINLELARKHLSKVPKDKFVQHGDVLINSTGVGTLGRVGQVYEELSDFTVDSHVSIVRPGNKVTIDYFGLNLIYQQDHFESLGTGSTGQTEINRESIASTDFLLPPNSLQLQFTNYVEPMRICMIGMHNKNTNLRRTRDLLLPKLISGELNVEHLDIIANEASS
jgi:type I restriction enzyme, S subunit